MLNVISCARFFIVVNDDIKARRYNGSSFLDCDFEMLQSMLSPMNTAALFDLEPMFGI